MAPRWFNNIRFGKDVTNTNYDVDVFKVNLVNKLDFTFESTGPIIEEVDCETVEPCEQEEIYKSPEKVAEPCEQEEIYKSPEKVAEPCEQEEIYESPEKIAEPCEQEEIYKSPEKVAEPRTSTVIVPEVRESPEKDMITQPRRSQRKRFQPLEFARGQRLVYKQGSVVGVEQGYPAKYDYSKKVSTNKKRKVPSKANPVETPVFGRANKGDYFFHCERIKDTNMIMGSIRLDPGKTKPETMPNWQHQYIFIVRTGQILFKVSGKNGKTVLFADDKSGWIRLQKGHRYSIRNCGTRTAEIVYAVSERVSQTE